MTSSAIPTRRAFLTGTLASVTLSSTPARAQTDRSTAVLSGPAGASLIGSAQGGTIQSFINASRQTTTSLGDAPYNAVMGEGDQTRLLQRAINEAPPDATISVPPGVRFNSVHLDFSANCRVALDHLVDDDIADIGFAGKASGERQCTLISSSKSPSNPRGGMVIERRLEGPVHPAWVVGVRPDMSGASSGLGPEQQFFPARAGFYIEDQRVDTFRIFFEGHEAHSVHSGVKLHAWKRSNELLGVGMEDWREAPAENALITGSPSGAKGLLRGVTSDRTTVDWIFGTFREGDTLRTGNQAATARVARVIRSVTPMPWISQDLHRGHWGIGLPAGYALDLLDVGGDVGVTPSHDSGQYQYSRTERPGFVWRWDLPSRPALGAAARQVSDESDKRVWVHDAPAGGTARGMLGAVCASVAFTNRLVLPPSAINVARVTNPAVGQYRIAFRRPMASIEYAVQLSMSDLMSATSATSFYTLGYRVIDASTAEIHVRLIDLAAMRSVPANIPAGAQISVSVLNGDI